MTPNEILTICAVAAFAIQWIAFVPAYYFKTEKFYDLTGSLTYLNLTWFAFASTREAAPRSWFVACAVTVWALRLGFYLFKRVLQVGEDSRFAAVKKSFGRFLLAWTLQGLWVAFTLAAALVAMVLPSQDDADVFLIGGAVIWLAGFFIEVIADFQKSKFRQNPENKGRFIATGLWACSRHPNYFGEIVLWIGMAVVALPTLTGWYFVALISPVFVIVLLTKGSGVPLLEAASDKRWGGQSDYEKYKLETPVLILKPPRRA